MPAPKEFEELNFEAGDILIPNSKQDSNFPANFELRKCGEANPTGARNAMNSREKIEKDLWSKYHYMKWTTTVDDDEIVEFDCIATVVMSAEGAMFGYSGTQLRTDGQDSCGLVVRIEWPAEADADKRNSKEFEYYVY